MATSKIFRSGNSLAVRIPKDFAIAREGAEVEVVEEGGAMVVRPKVGSMKELAAYLRANASPLMTEALERPEWPAHRLPPGADPES